MELACAAAGSIARCVSAHEPQRARQPRGVRPNLRGGPTTIRRNHPGSKLRAADSRMSMRAPRVAAEALVAAVAAEHHLHTSLAAVRATANVGTAEASANGSS